MSHANPTPVRRPRVGPVDRGLLRALEDAAPGAVRSRASDRLAYAHDASHYLLTPQAVVSPVGAGQVAALLAVSAAHGVPLTFRSGGTSLSGQASTDGVLVDTRRNFREIEVLDGSMRVRVQPGATVRQVNAPLAPHKRKLGPDPASLRAEQRNGLEQAGWKQAAQHWGAATRAGGLALSAVKQLPAPRVTAVAAAVRAMIGPDTVPLWEKDLPGGGVPRVARPSENAHAVYFPACIGTMFGPADGAPGVSSALLTLCERAGIGVTIPEGIGSMCCGTPWKSKGLTDGYRQLQDHVLPILWEASRHGQLPVVCDAASCAEGLERLTGEADDRYPGLRIVDAVTFVDEHILPCLNVARRLDSLALHPTCSSTHLGTNDALHRIANVVADDVVIPEGWGCCGFAGDRGMLHPELTASATRREAASVAEREFSAYASTNRTCELGMTRATGHTYQRLLEVLEQVTRENS